MIQLDKKYKPLILNNNRYTIISGGRGSGKSFSVNTILCLLMLEKNQRILFLRQTLTSAYISIIPEFLQKVEMLGLADKFKVTKTEIECPSTGSAILFRGIQTGSKSNTANLKSLQGVTCLVIDEAEEADDEKAFDRIDLSVRQKGIQNRVILILNPTTKSFWLYRRFFEEAGVQPGWNGEKDGVTYIHTDYRDNLDNLDESFLLEVEKIKKNNPLKYEHQILGGWLSQAEGVIYTNWQIGEFDTSLPVVYGADFGFSFDETTLTRCAVDRGKQIIYLEELVYKKGMTTDDIYTTFLRHTGFDGAIVADSAEPRLISELKSKGLNIKGCEKGPGSITAGISSIQDYKLIITPDSVNLARELNNYAWHNVKAGVPIDAYNHLCDGFRYACFPLIKSPKATRAVYVG